jgi:hypothetical protein
MPTLISDTLVPCMEPRPSGSTNIALEQTYRILDQCRGTRFTCLNMRGIRYKYKLRKGHTTNITVYQPIISKDKEDKSIEYIQVLHKG